MATSSPTLSQEGPDWLARLAMCEARSVSSRTSPSGPATDQIEVPGARSPAIDINDSQILKPGVGPRAITALALASLMRWSTCRGSSIQLTGKAVPAAIAPRIDL